VARLMVVRREWKRREDRRLSGCRQLRHRARSRAADHQVGCGERRGHIGDERDDLTFQSRYRKRLAQLLEPARAGLMQNAHRKSGLAKKRPTLLRRLVERARSLAA